MLLTFSKPQFEILIKENIKKHTIRTDKNNRWKINSSIQFWSGNPRNVNAKNKPHQFGTGVCSRILPIEIYPNKNEIIIEGYKYNNTEVLNKIAINDGFKNWEEMKTFFTEDFIGKLIFWEKCTWITAKK
jgi:hypothetical protein